MRLLASIAVGPDEHNPDTPPVRIGSPTTIGVDDEGFLRVKLHVGNPRATGGADEAAEA